MKLLLFETATEMCSVGLFVDGAMAVREQELVRGHAEQLLPMIDALLAEAGLPLRALDAIAFGRGPGGFTGVRLAASVAQGLAFGAELPVLPVSSLRAVAQQTLDADSTAEQVLVCNDARMGEVYTGRFARDPTGVAMEVSAERVLHPDQVPIEFAAASPGATASARIVIGAGRGFRAYPALGERLRAELTAIQAHWLPSVRGLLPAARLDWQGGRAVPAVMAQPVYLRDNVAQPTVI